MRQYQARYQIYPTSDNKKRISTHVRNVQLRMNLILSQEATAVLKQYPSKLPQHWCAMCIKSKAE